jgi:hypothetical protein
MVVFTLEQVTHPNPNFGKCFLIDVLLPGFEKQLWVVPAYIGEDYRRSMISPALARQLELDVDVSKGRSRGDVVLQTYFEGAPEISRTGLLKFEFYLTPKNAGEIYLHFAYSDLEKHFDEIKRYDPRDPSESPFLALWPRPDVAAKCRQIPIEIRY